MSTGNLLSIIIPCFNDGKYLAESVASAQECLSIIPGELIVVNDGSNDGLTLKILRSIEEQGIHVIQQENKGLGAARNSGIRLAKGQYILPLDSDDLIRAEYVREAIAHLDQHTETDVVYPDIAYFDGMEGNREMPEYDTGQLVLENYIIATSVYRKRVWEQIEGYDESMRLGWEDWDFWLRAAARGASFWHYPAVGLDYRVREGSLIQTTKLHQKELVQYIFSKPELCMAALARQKHYEAVIANRVYRSGEYRAGRVFLYPFRQIQRWFR